MYILQVTSYRGSGDEFVLVMAQRTKVGLSLPFSTQNTSLNIIQHVTLTMTIDTIEHRRLTSMLLEVVVEETIPKP